MTPEHEEMIENLHRCWFKPPTENQLKQMTVNRREMKGQAA